ncbi:MAG TPA: AEC family transporter [Roseiflexaceae bacterium]|nr:AEC family transporter [Roseiflexaceae bacterium]HMP39380.1 AEC family transporter [Roseiflexaceae bacterium]
MFSALAGIFLNILVPVFTLVGLGTVAGRRLNLETRTLTRFAYYLLTPAFVLDAMSRATIQADLALRMIGYTISVHLACAALAYAVARALGRPSQVIAAYILIAVFGNVGNFGLPIIQFAYGDEARFSAALYFVVNTTIAFVVGVSAANWNSGGKLRAALAVARTPAILAVPPALLINGLSLELPLFASRSIGLLAAALIPTMLIALGVQLAQVGLPRLSSDILLGSAVRLIGGSLLAFALATPFGIGGLERGVGILQASMPAAVLASIIALEYDLLPQFVVATVFVSTLLSVVSLTIILALL